MTCVSTYKDAETCYQEKNYDKENKEKITWCGQMLYPLSCGELVCM